MGGPRAGDRVSGPLSIFHNMGFCDGKFVGPSPIQLLIKVSLTALCSSLQYQKETHAEYRTVSKTLYASLQHSCDTIRNVTKTNRDKHRCTINSDLLIWVPTYIGNSEHYDVVQKYLKSQKLYYANFMGIQENNSS